MSKKSTSVTFDQTTIDTVSEMCDGHELSPSFSTMAENLIVTNPKYIAHVKSKEKPIATAVRKNKKSSKKGKTLSRNRRNI